MLQDIAPTLEDDVRDAVDEDERIELLEAFRSAE